MRSALHVLIGESPELLETLRIAGRAADSTATVLIQGESGTGKELLARLLHERGGRRAAGPFVALDCAAISEHLLEGELFGYEEGVLADLPARRPGCFESAQGGTLFLENVTALPLWVQAKVLRAVQEREVERLGGERPVPVDVRLVAATRQDLEQEATAGRFREDLYYRLAVVVLTMPPLRERGDDVRLLAEHFVGQCSCANARSVFSIGHAALATLQAYSWPGNVRQLKDTLEQAVLAATGPVLQAGDLPADVRAAVPATAPDAFRSRSRFPAYTPLPTKVESSTEERHQM